MSNFLDYARSELKLAGHFDEDSFYGGMLGEAVMKMCEVFDAEDHSGMSAGLALAVFSRLAKWEPLTPLTGEDDEWTEVGEQDGGPLYQNKRCSSVFKDKNDAYDINGKVFTDPAGVSYTSRDSRVPVTFPYVPETEYVKVNEEGVPL